MNAFLDLADRQVSAPVKAQRRAVEKRAARREEEHGRLAAARQRYERERLVEAFAGQHGEKLRQFIEFLDIVTLQSAAALIDRAREFQAADDDTRFLVLRSIDSAIIRLRERHKMMPFDDPLPGQPLNAFLTIREILR
jgi:hypothetical protein